MRVNKASFTTLLNRWAKLLTGLAFIGFSIAFMKHANLGLGLWDVLSDGLARKQECSSARSQLSSERSSCCFGSLCVKSRGCFNPKHSLNVWRVGQPYSEHAISRDKGRKQTLCAGRSRPSGSGSETGWSKAVFRIGDDPAASDCRTDHKSSTH